MIIKQKDRVIINPDLDDAQLPDEIRLLVRQDQALQQIRRTFDETMLTISGNPPQREIDTWKAQEDWAQRYLQDTSDKTLENRLLAIMTSDEKKLGKTNIERAKVIANGILAKAERLAEASAQLLGRYREAIKRIEMAKNLEDIEQAIAQYSQNAEAMLGQPKPPVVH